MVLIDGPPINVSESGQTAANLVAGRGYIFDFYGYREAHPLRSFMPPLYTSIIAVGMMFVPQSPGLALKLLQAVLSSLTCLVIFDIGSRLFDQWVALLSAMAVALYPVFLIVVAQPTVTVVNTFLLSLMVWSLLRLRMSDTLGRAVFAGFVVGLSALSRPLIVVFMVPILLWLWLNRAALSLRWWKLGIVAALTTVLTVAPWTLRNIAIHRAPVLISTNGGFTLWNGNNPFTTGSGFDVYASRANAYMEQPSGLDSGADESGAIIVMEPYPLPTSVRENVGVLSEVELDRALYRASWEFFRSEPRRWIGLTVAKVRALWWFRPNIGTYRDFYESSWIAPYKVMYTVLLILALAGILLTYRSWRETVLLYLLFGTLSVGYVSFNVITRYRWEMEPFLILLAGIPVKRIGEYVVRMWFVHQRFIEV